MWFRSCLVFCTDLLTLGPVPWCHNVWVEPNLILIVSVTKFQFNEPNGAQAPVSNNHWWPITRTFSWIYLGRILLNVSKVPIANRIIMQPMHSLARLLVPLLIHTQEDLHFCPFTLLLGTSWTLGFTNWILVNLSRLECIQFVLCGILGTRGVGPRPFCLMVRHSHLNCISGDSRSCERFPGGQLTPGLESRTLLTELRTGGLLSSELYLPLCWDLKCEGMLDLASLLLDHYLNLKRHTANKCKQ